MPQTFRDLINQVGVRTLAAVIGASPKHVGIMRRRNSVPFDYWPALLSAAPRIGLRGLTWDHLIAMRKEGGCAVSRQKAA